MERFFHKLQSLDRRWIYLVLAVTLMATLINSRPENPVVLKPVQDYYDTVQDLAAGSGQGKIVLVDTLFSASTLAENGTQARVVIRHLMLRHLRFATLSVGEPQGATYGPKIAGDLAKRYGYVYGKDWIDFGYQIPNLSFYRSFTRDIPGTIQVDNQENKPLESFPIMQGVKTINNVALLAECTASGSMGDWLQYVQPYSSPRLKIGYGCTGVMAAEAYPYLDSKQLIGMMPGMKGAADYEKLVDTLEAKMLTDGQIAHPNIPAVVTSIQSFPPAARNLMFTQSAAHIVIILFILFGNLGLFLSRRLAKQTARKEEA